MWSLSFRINLSAFLLLCDSLTGRTRRPPRCDSLASVRLAETLIRLCDEVRPYQRHDLDLTTPLGGIRFSSERHRLYINEVSIAERARHRVHAKRRPSLRLQDCVQETVYTGSDRM